MAMTYSSKSAFTFACVIAASGALAANPTHVVMPRNIDRWWLPMPHHSKIPPKYPSVASKNGVAGCVAVAYGIGRDGRVTHARIWRAVLPDLRGREAVEQAALHAIRQWRFVPAPGNAAREPAYTYIVDTFSLRNRRRSPERQRIESRRLRARCEIPDFVQQVHAKSAASGKQMKSQP
jgi:TonB family protein